MRDILNALEYARTQMFRFTSPDFIRARVSEDRVQRLCERLLQGVPAEARVRTRNRAPGAGLSPMSERSS
jgi:hypothetical protein